MWRGVVARLSQSRCAGSRPSISSGTVSRRFGSIEGRRMAPAGNR